MSRPAVQLVSSPLPDDEREILQYAYEGHLRDPFTWEKNTTNARRVETANVGQLEKTSVYGELKPETFNALLARVGARPGMNFVDLGSGYGKLVIQAWLHKLNSTGVELLRPRWQQACEHMRRLGSKAGIPPRDKLRFLHGSFLNYDFRNADIIFTDSVMFEGDMLLGLAKVAEHMKEGAYIISEQGLPGDRFRLAETIVGPASWSNNQTWTIQTVKPKSTSVLLELNESDPSPAPCEICSLLDDSEREPSLSQKTIARGDR